MSERQQRKPEKRPDEILDAATKVFARRGYDGARMDDIARQAGLSKGALYLYFASKNALLDAIVTRFADRFTTAISQDMLEQARQDPVDAVSVLVKHAITVASDPTVTLVPRLVMAEATRDTNIAALYRRRVLDVVERALSDVLEEGVRQGVFRRVRAASLVRLMLGPVMAHMMLGHVFVVEGQAALAPHVFEEELLAVLLDGLKTEEGA
ncbi:MAG: TetR/AcrR family transcriptional regulator [Pseudomonadota bacterium]